MANKTHDRNDLAGAGSVSSRKSAVLSLAAFFLIPLAMMAAADLPSATVDVSVTLKPGWNALYVPVAPRETAASYVRRAAG